MIVFMSLQFIPSLVASGTLVVGGNLIGQNRKEELATIITTGIVVNFLITGFVVLLVNIFAPQLAQMQGTSDNLITGTNIKEMDFVSDYIRILTIQLLFMSIAQVYIAGLQVLKKQRHVAIGAILSNFIDLGVVSLILFGIKGANPLWAALGIPLSVLFQMIYMIIINMHYIDYRNKKRFDRKFAIETIRIGLPITLEMGLWNVCNFMSRSAVAGLGTPNGEDIDKYINLNVYINTINQFSGTFLQAISTVTSILVAREIGRGSVDDAYHQGMNCWKISVYAQLILSTLTFSAVYPLLVWVFNADTQIVIKFGIIIFAIANIKTLFDTVNLTLLRALWAVGDLWTPLIVSIFTMTIGMVMIPLIIEYTFTGATGLGLIYIWLGILLDPIGRATIYVIRWRGRKWTKYAKKL
ncbi:MATE family efflux transporter [Williamsoniiplasma somnilux]